MDAELEKARKEAWSLRDGDKTGMDYIGSIQTGNRIYRFYKDRETGECWYETVFAGGNGIQSEEEYIFGKKIRKRHERR